MARVLGCEVYYSEQLDKAGVLVWFMGASPVIAATSALGMGVDIPNIRSIIYIGTPRTLLDYAQESGWAGWDGQRSKVIIIQPAGWDAPAPWMEGVAPEDQERVAGYIGVVEGVGCRWVVLDQYLDGVVDGYQQWYCQDADAGEQACDGCDPNWEGQEADPPRVSCSLVLCAAGSMVGSEGAREAACKSGSMVARQAAREAPCEVGSMVVREAAREAPCEAGSMVAREGAREAACEAGSMVAREAVREAACESGSMVAREGAREAPCEAGSMVAREGAREAACKVGSMVARQAAREAPCEAGSMVAREGAREAPCEAGSMVAREAASPTPSNDSFCSQPSIPMAVWHAQQAQAQQWAAMDIQQQQHRTQQGLDEEMAQAECMQW
ncbi:hypothetical protein KXV52_009093 [Aspergillus fumigatus]|nr:hypothetical protein KXX43_004945 [Aspergillus fumigatus]KAH3349870.1 hypothetical protein KXV52_009093 [Aspergillus fumigatus]